MGASHSAAEGPLIDAAHRADTDASAAGVVRRSYMTRLAACLRGCADQSQPLLDCATRLGFLTLRSGLIDDVRIYDMALSLDKIAALAQ